MNLGEKFAEVFFNYTGETNDETLSSLLADDFIWETITKARINDKIYENKEETLNTLAQIKSPPDWKIFYSTDEILVASLQTIAPTDNTKRGLIVSVLFEKGKAIKMISANGDGIYTLNIRNSYENYYEC